MGTADSSNKVMEQPQGLCDIAGLSFRIWRQNLPLILKVMLLPTILNFSAATALQWCFTYGISRGAELSRIIFASSLGFVSLVIGAIALFWLGVKQMALVRLLTGFSPDWKTAEAYAGKKLWWLVGLWFISAFIGLALLAVWLFLGTISIYAISTAKSFQVLGIIGFILSGAGSTASFLLFFLLCLIGFSVLACEDTTFFGVAGESWKWIKRFSGRIICFSLVFYIVITVVGAPVSLPLVLVSIVDMFVQKIQAAASGEHYKASIAAMLLTETWEGACSLLLRPVTAIAFGLLYLDLRQRADGIDLVRKLSDIKSKQSGEAYGIQGH